MSRWKKIVIGIILVINFLVGGATYYVAKVMADAGSAVSAINQTVGSTTSSVNTDDAEPFSIVLLGTDTGDLGRTDQGRSDSMMVVTLNPQKGTSTIVSLDRDILAKIVGHSSNDKLNSAYAYGGTKMAMNTIENLLDIPLDHYVTINMKGLKQLVNAVGGITVNNKYDFELDGVTLEKGKQTLNGKQALAYARMRYQDPLGDVGRQKRQREVVTKILKKVMSINGVSNYRKILKAVEDNAKTDLSWDEMLDIGTNYLPAFQSIKQVQLQGTDDTIDGIYYQILHADELLSVQNTLKKQLGISTDKTLSNLNDSDEADLFYTDSSSSSVYSNDYYDSTSTSESTYYGNNYGNNNGY